MKRNWKFLSCILSVLMVLTMISPIGTLASVNVEGFYCDFDDFTLNESESTGDAYLSEYLDAGFAFVGTDSTDTSAGLGIVDRRADGQKGVAFYKNTYLGMAMSEPVYSGKVKIMYNVVGGAIGIPLYINSDLNNRRAAIYTNPVKISTISANITCHDGTKADVGNASIATSEKGAWKLVEHIIDIDTDKVKTYVNGVQIADADFSAFNNGAGLTTVHGFYLFGGGEPWKIQGYQNPTFRDLTICPYNEMENKFSAVGTINKTENGTNKTTVFFDEPINVTTLPAAGDVSVALCGDSTTAIAATEITGKANAIDIVWSGDMVAGNEYRVDLGTGIKSTSGKTLSDGAYMIKSLGEVTETLIFEDFNDVETVEKAPSNPSSAYAGPSRAGGFEIKAGDVNAAAALKLESYERGVSNPGYFIEPHNNPVHPFNWTDNPDTTDYCAVPYLYVDNRHEAKDTSSGSYRIGDLRATRLGGMPKVGTVTWSFDYVLEKGSLPAQVKTMDPRGLIGESYTNITQIVGAQTEDKLEWGHFEMVCQPEIGNVDSWYGIYNDQGEWQKTKSDYTSRGADLSNLSYIGIAIDLFHLPFAIDNIKVTYTYTPIYVEGVRYNSRAGEVTGADSITPETNSIDIYFSEAVDLDTAQAYITLTGGTAGAGSLSADGKVYTLPVNGLLKGNSDLTLTVGAAVEAASGATFGTDKTYKLTTKAGRFAIENMSAKLNGNDITAAGTSASGDSLTVSADVINTIGNEQSYTIIYAYYNDDKLVDVNFRALNLDNTTYFKAESENFTPKAGVSYDEVRTFVWDGFATAEPLTGAEVYPAVN